ncbi:unnamed protein product [Adineta ricciae]|uniref:Phosphoglycerate mutase family protein n=1 Tax=Adineta ricciae TaxID=249248 RepID=A0A814L3C3_ADIRI|nr:unnamed protein product [Adineta ricciae]CAF1063673.1 unnamed protein product [Adineta ricciae]
MLGGNQADDNLRIIITRHGERADLAFGKQWLNKMLQNGGQDPRISQLAQRPQFRDWYYDPPLTVDGEHQSANVGQKLLQMGYQIDYCYSSPAYRSVQTATKILESQGRKAVPINIEPGLFECPSWYAGKPFVFVPPEYLAADRRFNVNPGYAPFYSGVDPTEDERVYYRRSRHLIREIIRAHKHQGGTVLLAAHGGSIEAVTRGLRGLRHRRGRPEHLIQEALRVDYCNFAILERDARTRDWIVRLPEAHNAPYGAELTRQSIIPLYGISTQHMTQQSMAQLRPRPSSHSRRHRHRHPNQYHHHHR